MKYGDNSAWIFISCNLFHRCYVAQCHPRQSSAVPAQRARALGCRTVSMIVSICVWTPEVVKECSSRSIFTTKYFKKNISSYVRGRLLVYQLLGHQEVKYNKRFIPIIIGSTSLCLFHTVIYAYLAKVFGKKMEVLIISFHHWTKQ